MTGRIAFLLLGVLLAASGALGARIEGAVYDLGLDRLDGVIVTVDTVPRQTMVSADGRYAFEVPPGRYTVNATQVKDGKPFLHTSQAIEVSAEGMFVVDLILFEEVDFEEDLVPTQGFDPDFPESGARRSPKVVIPLVILFVAGVAALVVLLRRRKKAPAPAGSTDEQIEAFIRAEGRTTQKEIYKRFPYSEAKISLLLTDLESQGKIQKIKKGRTNVIVWQRGEGGVLQDIMRSVEMKK